jgi:ABC-type Fe3+-siderophore transport system permease subunit
MENLSDVFITAIVFAAIYGILQLLIKRKERHMLIEKGVNMPEIKSDLPGFSAIKYGLFFIGIGIGILSGSILAATTILEKEVAYFSMIFLFGGIALIISHMVDKNKKID